MGSTVGCPTKILIWWQEINPDDSKADQQNQRRWANTAGTKFIFPSKMVYFDIIIGRPMVVSGKENGEEIVGIKPYSRVKIKKR